MSFHWKHSNTPFLIANLGEMHLQKKVSDKTMPRPYTKRTHQRVNTKMCHLDMPAGQTRSVKLGILGLSICRPIYQPEITASGRYYRLRPVYWPADG